jgi:hypothetical protein
MEIILDNYSSQEENSQPESAVLVGDFTTLPLDAIDTEHILGEYGQRGKCWLDIVNNMKSGQIYVNFVEEVLQWKEKVCIIFCNIRILCCCTISNLCTYVTGFRSERVLR